MGPDPAAILYQNRRAGQAMGLMAQADQLLARLGQAAGLFKPDPVKIQHLIGTNHQCSGMAGGNAQRLQFRQGFSRPRRIAGFLPQPLFDRLFINGGDLNRKTDPGGGQHGVAGGTGGG